MKFPWNLLIDSNTLHQPLTYIPYSIIMKKEERDVNVESYLVTKVTNENGYKTTTF